MDSISESECPVCGSTVLLKYINDHVDSCLQSSEKKRKIDSTHSSCTEKKKQSMLYFTSSSQPDSGLVSSSNHHHRDPECPPLPPPPPLPLMIKKDQQEDRTTPDDSITSMNHPSASSSRHSLSQSLRTTHKHTPTNKDDATCFPLKAHTPTNKDDATCFPLKAPLADLVRPTSIDGFVGQEKLLEPDSFLHMILQSGEVPSLVFWGPPGCGKTTLARIIAKSAQKTTGANFIQLSATTSGIADVKEAVKVAKNRMSLLKKKTVLFIDEIHRFNKLQQDSFLPHVENGTITLLGATTENPSFQLNSALLSRCKVIVLDKLQSEDIKRLLERALRTIDGSVVTDECCAEVNDEQVLVKDEAMTALANLCDGDARSAINGLQLAVQTKRTLRSQYLRKKHSPLGDSDLYKIENKPVISDDLETNALPPDDTLSIVTVQDVKNCLQKSHLLYDNAGDEHYNCISALHKSMRGSDSTASLYWLARMLCGGEDPLYVARRVIRFASEDIGLSDTNALTQAVAAFNACQYIGMPECEVILAQAVVYMARAPKSIEVYRAYGKAKACVMEHEGPLPSVPIHLRNAPTKLMRNLGWGHGYKYNPDFVDQTIDQTYMPEILCNENFFD